MKAEASISESIVPVSSHAKPRPKHCTRRRPELRYASLTDVISSSPRADGFHGGGYIGAARG